MNKSDLIETMLATIRRYGMMDSGEMVLAALSGGPDSVALLHSLHTLAEELGITLHAAHLNHSFRGEESDTDEEFVRTICNKLGVPCTSEKIDVPALSKVLRLSPEETARMVRYDFLDRISDKVGAQRIALGHTADDQVETVLLNLLRGSGIDGLSGMPAVRARIVRPLIDTRRTQVEEYLNSNHIIARTDSTNLTSIYSRNRVRLELLPTLRQDYNPAIDGAILRLSELAAEDSAYLCKESEERLRKIATVHKNGSIVVPAAQLGEMPLAIRRRVLRTAIAQVRGQLLNIGFTHIAEVLRLLETGVNFQNELPGGTFVKRTGSVLTISPGKPEEPEITYEYHLKSPGLTEVPEIDATIEVETGRMPVDFKFPRGSFQVVFDRMSILGILRVRNWLPGDRIRPLGLGGSKKVQDVFMDAKVPRELRYRVPILADDAGVLWVAGITVSESAKITDSSLEYLRIRVMQASDFAGS
jgi:tRNA(Ile)-lysidine synthase